MLHLLKAKRPWASQTYPEFILTVHVLLSGVRLFLTPHELLTLSDLITNIRIFK